MRIVKCEGVRPLYSLRTGLTPSIMGGMRWVAAVVVIGLALLAGFAPIDARLVERWYSTGVYPVIQRVLTPVSNLVPFALLDVLAVAASVCRGGRAGSKRPSGATEEEVAAASRDVCATRDVGRRDLSRVPGRLGTELSTRVDDRSAACSTAPHQPEAILELGRTSVRQLNALHAPAHAEGWRTSPWREHRMRDAYRVGAHRLSDAPRRSARTTEVVSLRTVLPLDAAWTA